jgi:glucosamine--fructose-6-phosphate aminotransferase (isomerizing)
MCGIVGAVAARDVVPLLIDGLKALEYRGYDSAGLAAPVDGQLQRHRAVGKVRDLAALQASAPIVATQGIAHTRWATHGVPSEANAHPHVSAETTCVVHNGIIENHAELQAELKAAGHVFTSETDTEVIAHLIEQLQADGHDLLAAVRHAVARFEGAYSIAVFSVREPGRIIGAGRGSPRGVGRGGGAKTTSPRTSTR